MNDTLINKQVKCFLRNTMVLEGIVEEWSDVRVVLSSLDRKSLMIIHKPTDDILMTKVMLDEEIPEEKPEPPSPNREVNREEAIKKKLEEALNDPNFQTKSVAELRQMVIDQEKEIIASKTKEHFGSAGNAKLTHYSSPYVPKALPNTPASRLPDEHPPSAYKLGKCKNNAD